MRRLYLAAIAYATPGLAGGLFYREITHARDFTGNTQLAVVHTHLLALGLLVMLIVLALIFTIGPSGSRWVLLVLHHLQRRTLITARPR